MPPRVGPMAGANTTPRPKTPIAMPRRSAGKTVKIVAMTSGWAMPARETLQDAGEDQAVLGRRRAAQQGAHRKEAQRAHEGAPLAQNAGQPGIDQHARGHGRHVGRRHPLRLVLADAEGAHHVGHRHVDRGHRQHHRDDAHHAGDGDQPAIGGAVALGQDLGGLDGGASRHRYTALSSLLSPARGRGGGGGSARRCPLS